MKKNVLALSIATMIGGLGFAGAASADVIRFTGGTTVDSTADAIEVAESGIGNALIVPYFTAQDGNMTVLHVTNTDMKNGKAVKVRFRGAANSDDILDFQLYLSPGDVWTGSVTKSADGVAQLTSTDNSCTIPSLQGISAPFVTGRLDQKLEGDALKNGTREGYVEIFNMADIPENKDPKSLYTTIKHVNGKAPCDPAFMNADFGTGLNQNFTKQADAEAFGFTAPTGTLQGNWYIVNVPQTTTYSGSATALKTITAVDGKDAASNFTFFPQALEAVSKTDMVGKTADPLLLAGIVEGGFYDLPDLSTPFVADPTLATAAVAQAAALTDALAVTTVRNQFVLDSAISGKTDWLLSMPSRRYSVAVDYNDGGTGKAKAVFTDLSGATPGKSWFDATNVTVPEGVRQACVASSDLVFVDREERLANVAGSKPVFSPNKVPGVTTAAICGETYVMSIGAGAQSVLGASVAQQNAALPTSMSDVQNGWASLSLKGNGLPVLGSAFIKGFNPYAAPGVSGNYGISWVHSLAK